MIYSPAGTNRTEIIFLSEPQSMEGPEVKPLAQVNLLLHSVLAKFLPCILIVIYGALLVKTLKTNIRMLSRHMTPAASDSFSPPPTNEEVIFYQDRQKKNEEPQNVGSPDAQTTFVQEQGGNNEMICLKCKNPIMDEAANVPTVVYLSAPCATPITVPKKRCSSTPPYEPAGRCNMTRHHDNSRTTRMLLLVITLYLVTELPQAVLIVLSATIPGFFLDVYVPLGDMMDMVALVNNGINFLLYCIMSRDFRTTLVGMLKSTLDRASEVPNRVSSSLYKPTFTVADQAERPHATMIVRSKEYRT